MLAKVPPDDPVVVLKSDEHVHGTDLATRVAWYDVRSPEERRVTVLQAIEAWAAEDDRDYDSEAERLGEAAEWVLSKSMQALVLPIVAMYPDFGGAARPFWREVVEAVARYPEAAALVLYDEMLPRRRRRR